nr:reverse transcriptase domain-containing protein [Tanacetum cinerariifolium]
FFPPSKTTNLGNEITRFQQRFDESFSEAWDRFNDLLRACPHHGFFELHQVDTFYNALNVNDHDSLNSTAGGNFLDKMPSDCLKIIESKSKVRQSGAKAVVAKVNSSSSTTAILSDGAAQIWLEKEPPRSILTWDDLVSKFINQFFPPSKTTNLRNEITRFQYRFDESFSEAWDHFNDLLMACPHHGFSELHQLDTFYNALNVNDQDSLNSAAGENVLDKIPSECLKIIESKSKSQLHRPQVNQPPAYQAPTYQAPIPQKQSVSQTDFERYVKANDAVLRNIQSQGQRAGTLPGNTITNPKEYLKGITTRSGVAYQGPTIPTPSKVVKQGTEVTKDQVQTPSSQSTTPVQPPVIQSETLVSEPVVAPVSVSMPNLKPSIPYPSRRDNERRREQANEQIEKFYEIFKDMSFEISFTDALILIPRMDECLALADLGASINLMPLSVWKELSLSELTLTCMTLELADRSVSKPIGIAKDVSVKVGMFHFPTDFVVVDFEPDPRVPLILRRCFLKTGRALIDVHKGELTLRIRNEAITYNLDQTSRYSANYDQMTANDMVSLPEAVLPIKDPQSLLRLNCKTRNRGMDECLALADLGASINLMSLFVWKGLSLLELTPTCMTLELADRSVSKPIGIAKDVSVKVGVFHFPADFVVVNFEPDPRVPLILERYSANYDQMTANKIDVTDEACEEYSQEVLGFSDVTVSGSPTPSDDLIVSTTSSTLTPFGNSDFLLFKEADAFLDLEDNPDSLQLDPSYYDLEGDILLLEAILNSDPSPPLPNQEQSVPSFDSELKACEAKTIKSSIDEPPEVKLKDLPPHLEYAFLEGNNKLP